MIKFRHFNAAILAAELLLLSVTGSLLGESSQKTTSQNFNSESSVLPNIIVIMSDDHSRDAISCYGNKTISTPGIDRLAREGIRFEHAFTTNSFCTPSRAAILTGKYSHKNGVTHLNQQFDGSQQTYPKVLQQAGYQTALFGKWHLRSRPTGFNYYSVMKMQGSHYNPTVWEPKDKWIPWEPGTTEWSKGGRKLNGYQVDVMTNEALNWIRNRDKNKPFCLLLHPKPPHEPYQPAPRYEDFLNDVLIPEQSTLYDDYAGRTPEAIKDKLTNNRLVLGPTFRKWLTEEQQKTWTEEQKTRYLYQRFIKEYYRLVKSVDDNVTRVLDFLKENDLEKNTIVIYTSDNGFFLGDHGFYNKMWMYESSLHVPMIIKYPQRVNANNVNSSMVSLIDVAPTLLDLAGLPVPDDMQGISLRPILEGKSKEVRDSFYYHFYRHGQSLPEMIGVRTKDYKLIYYPEMDKLHQWELFDLNRDADEMKNVYMNSNYQDIQKKLEQELQLLAKGYEDPVSVLNE